MAPNYIPTGYIIPSGEDKWFASTGAHLHAKVLKGQNEEDINPEFAKTFLKRILIGDKRVPLVSQTENKWNWSYPITSGYGWRSAPTVSYHRGLDFGIPGKTSLFWEGPGKFTPMPGYGVIETTDEKGVPYKIKLLHTTGGTAGGQLTASSAPPATTSATNISVQQPGVASPDTLTYNFIYGNPQDSNARVDPFSFLKNYGTNKLSFENLLGMAQQKSPAASITEILSQQPQFYG